IALSPKPGDRFSSASAMRQALVHAARDSNVAIDAPPAALKTRASLSIAEGSSGQHPVLGGIGLGVAPPAMLGPGNPAAMVAFDARRNAPPAQLPQMVQVEAAPAPISPPPMPVAEPEPPPDNDRGGTLAAIPSPYAPPYGYGGSSPGGTDAGMISPFANESSYVAQETPPEVLPSQETYVQTPRRRGSSSWLPLALGAFLVVGGVVLVVWALRPSSAAPPPPAPTVAPTPKATEDDEPPKKKKPKHPQDEEPTVPTPATNKVVPKTSGVVPKSSSSVKPPVIPSVSASTSTSVPKPPTSTSVPPDIIPLPPLPWPVP
ncbi:MAG: hypothetical protein ACXVEF_04930, partial [Polyangiales bacterium]